jgi:hypothetical protein
MVDPEQALKFKKRQTQKQKEESSVNSLCYLRALNDYLKERKDSFKTVKSFQR